MNDPVSRRLSTYELSKLKGQSTGYRRLKIVSAAILILFGAAAIPIAASEPEDIVGFRGFRWGAKVAEFRAKYPDAKASSAPTMQSHVVELFEVPDTVIDAQVSVTFAFVDGRFQKAVIAFPYASEDSLTRLQGRAYSALLDRYGNADVKRWGQPDAAQNAAVWRRRSGGATLSVQNGRLYAQYESNEWEQMITAQERKSDEGKF